MAEVTPKNCPFPSDEEGPWPFNGYAPGNYLGQCGDCKSQFEGAKRSVRCLPCAVLMAKRVLSAAPAMGTALRHLAERLTPNPARTVDGTLAVILDGIDRIDDGLLARAIAQAGARSQGLDAKPLTDEQWRDGDLQSKMRLLGNARLFKEALRYMEGHAPAPVPA